MAGEAERVEQEALAPRLARGNGLPDLVGVEVVDTGDLEVLDHGALHLVVRSLGLSG